MKAIFTLWYNLFAPSAIEVYDLNVPKKCDIIKVTEKKLLESGFRERVIHFLPFLCAYLFIY